MTSSRSRGAVDPRLLTYARSTRTFIATSVALGTVTAALIIAQAWLLAGIITAVFVHGDGALRQRGAIEALLCVVLARSVVAWGADAVASRSSAQAKSQLRAALLAHVAALGPGRFGAERRGELSVLATRGIDALDGYFSLYLPQLVLALIVPTAVVAVVLYRDWLSALIIAGTLPLIPLFMALVGATTRDRMAEQVRTLQHLAGHFLDVVGGLPTLKVFGRAKAQIRAVGEVTDDYRRTAMSTLRVTFLSSLILELVATISVALVAVEVGLRLMGGHLDLRTALIALVLAPEAYLPLRRLGASYHASAEGLAAAQQVFSVLEAPLPTRGSDTDVPDPAEAGITLERVRVTYPDRAAPVLDSVSLQVEPGEVLALTGPSGCGKSTLLNVLLGFVAPESGSARVGDKALADLDPDAWRARLSWVPQRPHLFAASIADNIRIGRPEASGDQLWEAVVAAGLVDVVTSRPGGVEAMLGERGFGLSVGERQRIGLARAFLRDTPLLLLDEPTANLDGATEAALLQTLSRIVRGRTAVLVAHRPALIALADRVVELDRLAVAA